MTRIAASTPRAVLDPDTRAPLFGAYAGGLPRVDLAPAAGALARLRREKRWMYATIATDDVIAAVAIVRLGYAANAFAFVIDRRSGRIVADESAIAPPFAASVEHGGEGSIEASFRGGMTWLAITRSAHTGAYVLDVRMRELRMNAWLDGAAAPPALGVVASLGEGLLATTEKRAPLAAHGQIVVNGQGYSLEGGLGGYDFSQGLLPRHTAWRWAFMMGRAKDGRPVGVNLTEGFVGARECVVWVDGAIVKLPAVRFDFDRARPQAPWHVRSEDGRVELGFVPAGVHREARDLGVARSRFLQTAGDFRGRIELPGGEAITLERMPGVTEDQDVLW
ncbi:DUF2804 domain-containing protein [Polyangium aurulentum]|uniref:DUF2804 domain-containing protein n=1 Tax=Polyangium aurulentum TaxID=2567896 RepID=UPI0010ADEC1A|nr:DUF2804 domain-containing protein [Polyangium aurulentum]UQA55888.1 DUF2804 domain-containing protein [Polyangium aurulentum]